ncbi:uncharacterized protein LOC143146869 isoform X2 [Ptiloglossa arizonensis]|uniref:uncharacterized protein LOC143146869 isoform X2 n=1 Tax=Ptiloglossa arizonensis TaxID=3350558 RepID=UPI003F9F93B2
MYRMSNENAPVCGCGKVVEISKSRNGALSSKKVTLKLQKSKGGKSEVWPVKKQQDEARSKNKTSETGSSSSVAEQARQTTKSSKYEKRLNHWRRTRSADRMESHYTYIDSASSILASGYRDNAIPEALYAIISDTTNPNANETGNSQLNAQSRSQPVYAIPSMVSPPPTYDVAISKTWQSGLPPTYEEYLCHKDTMLTRSHTPPPPWSDSATTTTLSAQTRRELLASQPELREYLAQLSLSQHNDRSSGHHQHHHQQASVLRDSSYLSNQQVPREKQVSRTQKRARAMPPRSQSESRVQQQRISTMYDDGAFCMETTALQSAVEDGISLCSLM